VTEGYQPAGSAPQEFGQGRLMSSKTVIILSGLVRDPNAETPLACAQSITARQETTTHRDRWGAEVSARSRGRR